MIGYFEVGKMFREQEFGGKLEKARNMRMKEYEDIVFERGNKVFYQTQNEKAWLGPAIVKDIEKNWVWIFGNGDLRKVPRCNVKLSKKGSIGFEEDEMNIFDNSVDKIMTRLMMRALRKEKEIVEIYTVEIPTKGQNTLEVKEAK